MNLVETRKLTKRYGPRAIAVDGVDLTVRRGEIYGFLGPNGAGKTTTLRMLLGLVRPTSGEVSVLGYQPGHRRALADVGALIESPAFYPYLSGRDNLRALARVAGVPQDRVTMALELVSLSDRAADRFSTYSLGMKQRLGVAAALLGEPELLVLDEPTNGLDPAGMRDMRSLIRGLGSAGYTVLLSSHLLGEVQQICDRVGVLVQGRLLVESTVDELRGDAELHLVAEPLDVAWRCLDKFVDGVTRSGDGLRFSADAIDAATLNRALYEAGATIVELYRVERSLEDAFFEMTEKAEASHAG